MKKKLLIVYVIAVILGDPITGTFDGIGLLMEHAFAENTDTNCGVGLCIEENEVAEGNLFNVNFLPLPGRSFGWNFSIYRDSYDQSNFLTNPSLTEAQDSVPPGTSFTMTLDSLNWSPGHYVFHTSGYFDTLEVTPRDPAVANSIRMDMLAHGRALGLYGETGNFINDEQNMAGSLPILAVGAVHAVAVDLNQFLNLRNHVEMQFLDPEGSEVLFPKLLEMRFLREYSMNKILTVHGDCLAQPIDPDSIPDGVAVLFFRSPKHHPFYENDGQVRFVLAGNLLGGPPGCSHSDITVPAFFDDSSANKARASFEEYNATHYPNDPNRNNFPLDTLRLRFVRFGNLGLMDPSNIQTAADDIKEHFSIATKGYFTVTIDGISVVPYDDTAIVEKVLNWYETVPKTSDKPILDLNSSDEFYLATLLYYYEHDENEFVDDLTTRYPPRSMGEDLTVYWFDGPGSGGRGMGNVGATRVKITRLYPGSVFYEGFGEARTYHYDLASCSACGNTTSEYLSYLGESGYLDTFLNTTIHEFGHVLWSDRSGFSAGDGQAKLLPFSSDWVIRDRSIGFFTHLEYMSYERNRTVLDGMSYGDSFLQRLLLSYAEPAGYVEFQSHINRGENVIYVAPDHTIELLLGATTGSGAATIGYLNTGAPTTLTGAANSTEFTYGVIPKPTKTVAEEASFSLNTIGHYQYIVTVTDQLHGLVPGHPHEFQETFTVHVVAPNSDMDQDGVVDLNDNCPAEANPVQADSDLDGIGNPCDEDSLSGDFINPVGVDLADFWVLTEAWLSSAGEPDWNNTCNLVSSDDIINIADLVIFCENWLTGKQ